MPSLSGAHAPTRRHRAPGGCGSSGRRAGGDPPHPPRSDGPRNRRAPREVLQPGIPRRGLQRDQRSPPARSRHGRAVAAKASAATAARLSRSRLPARSNMCLQAVGGHHRRAATSACAGQIDPSPPRRSTARTFRVELLKSPARSSCSGSARKPESDMRAISGSSTTIRHQHPPSVRLGCLICS